MGETMPPQEAMQAEKDMERQKTGQDKEKEQEDLSELFSKEETPEDVLAETKEKERQEKITKLFPESEQNSGETQNSASEFPLHQEKIDAMAEKTAEKLGNFEGLFLEQNGKPRIGAREREILQNLDPEKVNQEWSRIPEAERNFIEHAPDEQFERVVGKNKNKSEKAKMFVMFRQLLKWKQNRQETNYQQKAA